MIIALLGVAFAGDIPERPETLPPVHNQCEVASPVSSPCAAVAVPTSEAADLLNIEIWGDELFSLYTLDMAAVAQREEILRQEIISVRNEKWRIAGEATVVGFALGVLTYAVVSGSSPQ
jgi:hypothetical protein